MDRQGIYDKVKAHLLKQGQKARRAGASLDSCFYRGHNGLKCAIGALIPDELYKLSMEQKSVSGLIREYPEVGRLFEVKSAEDLRFLSYLQSIHDNREPEYWKMELKNLALTHGLTP